MNTVKNQDDLFNEQAKVISKLQDTIRLMQFDITKNNEKMSYLEDALKRRKQTMGRARKALVEMKRDNDYSNINHVLLVLRSGEDEE